MKNTHARIIKILEDKNLSAGSICIDLPCGKGPVLKLLLQKFPTINICAVDIATEIFQLTYPQVNFQSHDLSKNFRLGIPPADLAVCISGIMEFENTDLFLKNLFYHLKPGALLLMSNDNIQTLPSRLSFLLFGKYAPFALFLAPGFTTYKAVSIQEHHKLLSENNFIVEEIHFPVSFAEDWFWLPLALPLWLIQTLFGFFRKSPLPMIERFKMFPPKGLLARQYIIVAKAASK